MAKGTTWSEEETAIMRDNLDKTPAALRKILRDAGYEREYFSISNKKICIQKPKVKDRVKLKFSGVSYKKVLDVEQQVRADHFLRCLKTTNRKAIEAGVAVDIMKFINAYACEYGKGGDMSERLIISDYRKQQILTLSGRGYSATAIATNIGLSPQRVSEFLLNSKKGVTNG